MECLSPGQLICLWCDWLDKSKYFLVGGIDEVPLLLYISSNKPAFCQNNPSVDNDFLLLQQTAYPFLAYDSWLDCGDVCKKFPWPSVEYQLRNAQAKNCGKITMTTRDEVIQAVGRSERLSTRHQRIISDALQILR